MKGNGVKKKSTAINLFAAIAGMFTKTPVYDKPTIGHRSRFRNIGTVNRSGSKIRRAIRRGNFGLTNKHGTIGSYFAEKKREQWLLAKGKPVITLSTNGGF